MLTLNTKYVLPLIIEVESPLKVWCNVIEPETNKKRNKQIRRRSWHIYAWGERSDTRPDAPMKRRFHWVWRETSKRKIFHVEFLQVSRPKNNFPETDWRPRVDTSGPLHSREPSGTKSVRDVGTSRAHYYVTITNEGPPTDSRRHDCSHQIPIYTES